ncbi:glutamine cyclotransferase [Dyadobacter sediminis]|nr:glutamine cyclotransferase [Dyadobacter sediminis]
MTFFSCNQERKSDSHTTDSGKNPVATLPKSSYATGDSITVAFTQPVRHFEILWNGLKISDYRISAEKVGFKAVSPTTGWKQLVVNGTTNANEPFADTLSVTLISDIVPTEISYTLLASYPHQKSSFTEGLEFHNHELYESTGENGKSQLLKVDLQTGAILKSVPIAEQYFGEGMTVFRNKIYQLTWQSGIGFRYHPDFTLDKTFSYYTQGWGMTHNDTCIIMGDGSNRLFFFDAEFEKTGEVEVYDNQGPVLKINELEYVDGYVYANIWETNQIVQIDLQTGKVTGKMDMKKIVPAEVDRPGSSVLNGIAYQPSENAFYITGKNWPSLFKIRIATPKNMSKKNVVRM